MRDIGAGFAAVIFDLDGLLIDTERTAVEAGVEAVETLGQRVDPTFIVGLVGMDEREGHRRLVDHLGVDLDFHALDDAWRAAARRRHEAGVAMMHGADIVLEALAARDMPRAVATNSRTEAAGRKLRLAGLDHHFEIVVGFDIVAAPKPAPDVYLEAARRLGVVPDRCLAFEDSVVGTAAALAAGMTVAQVPDLVPGRHEAAHHVADTLIDAACHFGLLPVERAPAAPEAPK